MVHFNNLRKVVACHGLCSFILFIYTVTSKIMMVKGEGFKKSEMHNKSTVLDKMLLFH